MAASVASRDLCRRTRAMAQPAPRRASRIDAVALATALKDYVREVGSKRSFVLGHYEFLRKDNAVHARSLHQAAELVVGETKWEKKRRKGRVATRRRGTRGRARGREDEGDGEEDV